MEEESRERGIKHRDRKTKVRLGKTGIRKKPKTLKTYLDAFRLHLLQLLHKLGLEGVILVGQLLVQIGV